MKLLAHILMGLVVLSAANADSQVCVPETYSFNSPGDYSIHRPTVLKCMKWLIRKPLHRKTGLRSEAEAYCMQWLCGHPELRVVLESPQVPYLEQNAGLLFVYLSKWTLLSREEPSLTDLEKHLKSTKTVLKLASKSKGLAEDETLNDLLRKWRNGELAQWAEQTWKSGR